jgi:DNA-binding response OmpR family regulator
VLLKWEKSGRSLRNSNGFHDLCLLSSKRVLKSNGTIIRSDARFDALPIVAMTVHVMWEEREKIKRTGINDYISKPFNDSLNLRLANIM